jgi:hypothetical protein
VQRQIGTLVTGALAAASGLAVLGKERAPLAKARERRIRGVSDDQDVAAASPVAAIRAAVGDVLLAAEADRSPPA